MTGVMSEWNSTKWITERDFGRSRTSYNLDDLRKAVQPLQGVGAQRLLDIGCGFAGLSRLVGDYIGAKEVHGVDIDDRVIEEAQSKGVEIVLADAGEHKLPYPDGHFDAIMTLGMMDYLVSFDPMIREVNRLLAPGGSVLVALPNLGSWHNRAMLLLGYQPRDVEISSEVLAGVPRGYEGELPAGHIHIPTVRAFTELMTHHGFRTVKLSGGRPRMRSAHKVLEFADSILTRKVTLARRFYYLGEKERSIPEPEKLAHLPYQSL